MIIFVTGSSRSGTTLMSRILNQNSAIFSFNEIHYFEQLCDPVNLNKVISEPEALELADKLSGIQHEGFLLYKSKGKFNQDSRKIVSSIHASNLTSIEVYKAFINYFVRLHDKIHGCDQTPRNVLYMEEILKNIPGAKVICMVRDPRSVLLSQKRKWKRKFLGAAQIPFKESVRSYFNYHPYTISKLWSASTSQSVKWQENENVKLLKFEDLVDDPEESVRDLCKFLNVDFEIKMLDVPHVGSSNKADESKQRGISSSAKSSWQEGGLSESELYICQSMNKQLMEKLGYSFEEIGSKPYVSLFGQAVSFPIKMSVALLLNLKRVKNLKQAIMRRL